MSFRSILLTLILACPIAGARADPPDPLLTEVTGLGGLAMFLQSGAPGMVLVVVRGDRSLVLGYGETTKGNNHEPDGTSQFRLNSITKVFTTEMLARLAAEGKLRLTDPLQAYAGHATVPTSGPRAMTLLDLATHSAGLPREMGEPPPNVSSRAWPTRADRWTWLPSYHLPWAPGTIASYSNVGFDLLADAIETAGGSPYAELLRTRVTAPVGMPDTGFTPTPAQCARLMTGTGLGRVDPCGDTQATDGSGGLYSTGNDMARWLRHNIADKDGVLALSHAVYRPRQTLPSAIGFDEAGPMDGLALGWVFSAAHGIHPALLEKSGGGAGFMSYIAFAPGRDVGVFVAVSRVDFGMFGGLVEGANSLIANLVTR